jgi:hypothetical protein
VSDKRRKSPSALVLYTRSLELSPNEFALELVI